VAKRGEHNREVLNEWLELDAEACEELETLGVLEFAEEEPPSLDEAPRTAFRESESPEEQSDGGER
jgi:hypothetical protein